MATSKAQQDYQQKARETEARLIAEAKARREEQERRNAEAQQRTSNIIPPSERTGYQELKGTGTVIASKTPTGGVSYSYSGLTPEEIKTVAQATPQQQAQYQAETKTVTPTQDSLQNQIKREQNLKDINKGLTSGDIQGYSGTTLTKQQIAKKELLEKLNIIPTTLTYGEYYKGTTEKGKETLKEYSLLNPITPKETISQITYQSPPYYKESKLNINLGVSGGGGTASAITSEDISILATGTGAIYKGGLLIGSQILLSKPITELTSQGIEKIIPMQNTGFSNKGILPQLGRGGIFLATTPITGIAFAYQFGKSLLEHPIQTSTSFIEFGKKNPYELGIVTIGARPMEKITEFSILGKKPYKIEPTKEMESSVEPFTRQSSRLFLTDESGKYILGKSGGEYISIGGGIEKGQTPRSAVLTELKQETGLGIKDITNLKSRGKVVYPEETMNIFTATISKEKLSKIKPSSDISEIGKVSPKNILIKGSTGQTAYQPISRFGFIETGKLGILKFGEIGKIRSYEAGIINFLETGKKPTWLAIDTKQGSFILGTQSRYNVPFKSQSKFLNKEDLLLAHGTTQPSILRRYFPFEKSDIIQGAKTRRGQAEGMYLQPPISSKKGSMGYIGLSYLGYKTSQAVDYLGIKIGKQKSTTYLFKEKTGKEITYTPKTLSGMEEELIIRPETKIGSKGRAEVFSIGFKRVYAQPSRIIRDDGDFLFTPENTKTIKSISEQGRYRYISEREISSPISVSLISKSKRNGSSQNIKISRINSNISKEKSTSKTYKSYQGISKQNSDISMTYGKSSSRYETPSKSIISKISKSISNYPSKSISRLNYKSKPYKFNEPSKTKKNIEIPKLIGTNFKRKKLKGISQPMAYTPSLGSSIFNIKLGNKKQLKSGKVSVFQRRGTLSLKQLRKINKGSSIF